MGRGSGSGVGLGRGSRSGVGLVRGRGSEVENVDNIQPRRTYGQCSFCGDSDGVKVLCSIKSCNQSFHATCGLAWGCHLEDVASANETYANRVVYCIDHRPKVINAGNSKRLKLELSQSQDTKAESNRNSLGMLVFEALIIIHTCESSKIFSDQIFAVYAVRFTS